MNMNSMSNKMMDRFFRRVDGVVWDLMTGRIGVKTADGIVTIDGVGDDAQITQNLFDEFGMAVPAFAQSTPLDALKVGDLIYAGNTIKGWIIDIVEPADSSASKKFTLMNPGGVTQNWKPPKVSMLGLESGVMVLRSLMNMLPGGAAGLGNLQGMMLPMMMMGGDNMDLDKMMPLMLMGQLGTDGSGNGAMGNNMVQMMMLMQMMKGGKGRNGNGGGFFDDVR